MARYSTMGRGINIVMNRSIFLQQWLDFPRRRYDYDFICLQTKLVFVGTNTTGVLASLWENRVLVSSTEVNIPVRVTPEFMRNCLFPSLIDRI